VARSSIPASAGVQPGRAVAAGAGMIRTAHGPAQRGT
jgi:hypothetical protein